MDETAIMRGYLGAALWADAIPEDMDDDGETGGLQDAYTEGGQLWPDGTLDDYRHHADRVMAWCEENAADLAEYLADIDAREERIGHDLWLTENGHGAGFWAHGSDAGERLSEVLPQCERTCWAMDDGTVEID